MKLRKKKITLQVKRPIKHNFFQIIDFAACKELPPKPGEPETWEKVTIVPNRFIINSPEDAIKANEKMCEIFEEIGDALDAMDDKLGLTPYEREYVLPMSHQWSLDFIQFINCGFVNITVNETAKDGDPKISLSIEEANNTMTAITHAFNDLMRGTNSTKNISE